MTGSIYDWSLTAANNSNADGDLTWAEGQAPSTVNNSARVMMQRVKQLLVDIGGSIAAGGTANGLTVTANSPFTALADGQIISFRATASNTGAATLNVNSIGAKAIRKMGTSGDVALAGGDIRNTGIYIAQYSAALNGAAGAWLLVGAGSLDTLTLQGAAIASAATTDIGAATGRYVHVTGSVAITALGTVAAGVEREVVFDAAPLLTYNATSLILPGAVNIQAAAGDVGVFVSEGSGNWRCIAYRRASLTAYKPPTVQIISTPGAFVYTPSLGAKFAIFEGSGGGAGAGGVNGLGGATCAATGGGGGGFSGRTGMIDITGAASFNGSIGAAGAAGTGGVDGGNGGDTTITVGATTYTWGGGVGSTFLLAVGSAGTVNGGAGGVGTNVVGNSLPGIPGIRGNQGTNTDNNAAGGAGASSLFGTGGAGARRISAGTTAGNVGVSFGAGGGGAANLATASNANGGAGTAGYMRVWEYY